LANGHANIPHGFKLHRHPFGWIAQLLRESMAQRVIDSSAQQEFSIYEYTPRSLRDARREFLIPVSQINEQTILSLIMDIPHQCELAVNSRVYSFGQVYHIPMIDFGYKGGSPAESDQLMEFCRYWNMAFYVYSSGRSYHGYGNRLLDPMNWIKFMGSLLLLNQPSGYKLIDERWVGHRILGGYSSLRWSKNTSHYKKFPTFCGSISPDRVDISPSGEQHFLPPKSFIR